MEATDPLQQASDLIDFYAGGAVPMRNVELLKHRVSRKITKQATPELKLFAGYRETLKELQLIHSRRLDHAAIYQIIEQPLLRELLRLQPRDFFLLLSGYRYQIPDELLSVILDMSVDHLKFRRDQLAQRLGAKPAELQQVCTAPIQPYGWESERALQRRNVVDRFRSLPLPARFLFETGIVLSVLIFLMWLIPEVRNRYENSIQKRINDYMIESTITDAPAPEGVSKTPRIVEAPPEEPKEPAEDPEVKPVETTSKKPLRVNAGETWRFSFTGAATHDILAGLNDTLKKMGLDEPKAVTVPGGIQFDFFIPVKELTNLKLNLEEMTAKLQRRVTSTSPDTPAAVNMSWYKKRGMTGRKVPAGNVEVIFWVSTL